MDIVQFVCKNIANESMLEFFKFWPDQKLFIMNPQSLLRQSHCLQQFILADGASEALLCKEAYGLGVQEMT